MATIQDVARAAGVAASTVSRYLNGQLRVTPATEATVLEAVSDLGYVPERPGPEPGPAPVRRDRLRRPRDQQPVLRRDRRLRGRGGGAARPAWCCCARTRSQAVQESSYIDLLASGAIDGMLYLGSFRSNERLAAAIRGGLPVVVVDEPIAGLPAGAHRGHGRLRRRVPGRQLPGGARPPPDRVRVRPGRARLGAGAAPRLPRRAGQGRHRPGPRSSTWPGSSPSSSG